MKLLVVLVFTALAAAKASVLVNPVNAIAYSVPAVPEATSYQFVSRNVNRVLVPRVTPIAYPGYVGGGWNSYPYNYHYDYGGYGYPYGHVHNYGYGYPYGSTVW